MDLLKQVVALTEEVDAKSIKDFMKQVNLILKGEEVTAFGKKSKGLWGQSDEPKTFKIDKVVLHYLDDEDPVGTIDVYLQGYKSKDNGLIYTDKAFLASFRALLKEKGLFSKFKYVEYSEQGMQGNNFVNMDVEFKLKAKK